MPAAAAMFASSFASARSAEVCEPAGPTMNTAFSGAGAAARTGCAAAIAPAATTASARNVAMTVFRRAFCGVAKTTPDECIPLSLPSGLLGALGKSHLISPVDEDCYRLISEGWCRHTEMVLPGLPQWSMSSAGNAGQSDGIWTVACVGEEAFVGDSGAVEVGGVSTERTPGGTSESTPRHCACAGRRVSLDTTRA